MSSSPLFDAAVVGWNYFAMHGQDSKQRQDEEAKFQMDEYAE